MRILLVQAIFHKISVNKTKIRITNKYRVLIGVNHFE